MVLKVLFKSRYLDSVVCESYENMIKEKIENNQWSPLFSKKLIESETKKIFKEKYCDFSTCTNPIKKIFFLIFKNPIEKAINSYIKNYIHTGQTIEVAKLLRIQGNEDNYTKKSNELEGKKKQLESMESMKKSDLCIDQYTKIKIESKSLEKEVEDLKQIDGLNSKEKIMLPEYLKNYLLRYRGTIRDVLIRNGVIPSKSTFTKEEINRAEATKNAKNVIKYAGIKSIENRYFVEEFIKEKVKDNFQGLQDTSNAYIKQFGKIFVPQFKNEFSRNISPFLQRATEDTKTRKMIDHEQFIYKTLRNLLESQVGDKLEYTPERLQAEIENWRLEQDDGMKERAKFGYSLTNTQREILQNFITLLSDSGFINEIRIYNAIKKTTADPLINLIAEIFVEG